MYLLCNASTKFKNVVILRTEVLSILAKAYITIITKWTCPSFALLVCIGLGVLVTFHIHLSGALNKSQS